MYSRPARPERLRLYIAAVVLGFAVTFGGTVAYSLYLGQLSEAFMEGMSPGPALMAYGIFGAARCLARDRDERPEAGAAREGELLASYLSHHAFVLALRQLELGVTLLPAALAVPLDVAVVFVLSLGAWRLLSWIPFVNKHLI